VTAHTPALVCIGGATVDRTYRAPTPLIAGTSNPVASAPPTFGGVARNVAENAVRLGLLTTLVSIVGNDENGLALARDLDRLGIGRRLAVAPRHRTAEYVAVLAPSGDLAFGLADMDIFDAVTAATLDEAWPLLAAADWVFADCNLPEATLAHLITRRRGASFKLALDSVSTPKVKRLPQDLAGIDCLFGNRDEACALLRAVDPLSDEDLARAVAARGPGAFVMTLGARGALLAESSAIVRLPAASAEVADVTGAGDALIAATLWRLAAGEDPATALRIGILAASLTIERNGSVRPDLSPGLLLDARRRIESATTHEDA
jgi:pseudouridine kinase